MKESTKSTKDSAKNSDKGAKSKKDKKDKKRKEDKGKSKDSPKAEDKSSEELKKKSKDKKKEAPSKPAVVKEVSKSTEAKLQKKKATHTRQAQKAGGTAQSKTTPKAKTTRDTREAGELSKEGAQGELKRQDELYEGEKRLEKSGEGSLEGGGREPLREEGSDAFGGQELFEDEEGLQGVSQDATDQQERKEWDDVDEEASREDALDAAWDQVQESAQEAEDTGESGLAEADLARGQEDSFEGEAQDCEEENRLDTAAQTQQQGAQPEGEPSADDAEGDEEGGTEEARVAKAIASVFDTQEMQETLLNDTEGKAYAAPSEENSEALESECLTLEEEAHTRSPARSYTAQAKPGDTGELSCASEAADQAQAEAGGEKNVLRVSSLYKSFGRKTVVKGVEFSMTTGEVLGLLGPNGAGKTTTFYMIVGFYKPTSGDVFLDEKRITHLPMYKRARAGISYLPQEPSVFRKLTVEENIWAILETRKDLTHAQKKQKLNDLIDEFAIGRIRKQPAYTLSGGERRRTEIARSLAIEPKFLLLDEPFAGIDPIAVADIKSMIRLLSRRGIGILITDHNVRDTLEITDRAIIISTGTILVSGGKEDILRSREAREIYLGKDFSM